MFSRLAISWAFAIVLAVLVAQGDAGQVRKQQGPTPRTTPTAQKEAPKGSQRSPLPRGRDVNVQIEVTITDQTGSAAPLKKTVSLIAADQTMGRVRAGGLAKKDTAAVATILNLDAMPTLMDNDRVLLQLTLEYKPFYPGEVPQDPATINESLVVILLNGKAMAISQAADPVSDRRTTVDVKATVLK